MWPILPPKNYFRFLVTPISRFWFVTDANLYLVFADVFVLVCISLLCVTKAFSVICHSHRQLLIHRSCTKWSLVHPLQCAWICAASFLWPDTKGNLSRLTHKIRTCSVSKVDYRKVLDFLIKTNQRIASVSSMINANCFDTNWEYRLEEKNSAKKTISTNTM